MTLMLEMAMIDRGKVVMVKAMTVMVNSVCVSDGDDGWKRATLHQR